MTDKFTCDTSVIFDGLILNLVDDGDLGETPEILISNIVVAEIEYRTNIQKEIGFYGLKVLKQLREWDTQKKIKLSIVGKRPTREEIKMAPGGELDALIRDIALKNNAVLITADRIQGDIGVFEGLEVIYAKEKVVPTTKEPLTLKLIEFFDETTMSVHLKRNLPPYAKKGRPGDWHLENIRDEPLSLKEIEDIALEVVEKVREDDRSFLEIEKKGAVVAQLREIRVVITRPPFSNDVEITAVHPIVQKKLEDYALSSKLKDRLQRAEGILVCGSPGAGKSTFAAALANDYLNQDKIVKTLESVRDLQVRPEITQYTQLEGSLENSADILLLVRPDYTIFDEVRTTKDFEIFSDFRLSGVGMVGVVHSSSAIDAVQRFIGRVELGMLPSIIDTILFIDGGEITSVLVVKMTVKVPSGFKDKDLARPVVEVRDYQSGQLAFELYSFGQDIVVNPINPPVSKRTKKRNESFKEETEPSKNSFFGEKIQVNIDVRKDKIVLSTIPTLASQNIEVFANNQLMFTGSLSRTGEMNLSLASREGKKILKEFEKNREIYAKIK